MPTDSFAKLQLPRRPYLSEETVRDAFHRLAAEHHPDRTGGESLHFAQLTTAFEVLRRPVARLRHLIDLEGLEASGNTQTGIPPDLADLFPAVAQARQQIAAALERKRAAQNALARSLATVDSANAHQSAEHLAQKLETLYSAALDDLSQIDTAWPDPAARAALPALHARFAFLTKWRDQLRESLLQLQLA
jgi:curved DNA-binding protein CbpA